MQSRFRRVILCTSALALAAGTAAAQDRNVRYTLYGTPGLIEMPTAMSAPDGEIAGGIGFFAGQHRINFTFQITPRLSGTFRYAGVDDFNGPGTGMYYDRSFDLRYRFNDEGDYIPAIAVGLQDFMGTSLFQSEYIVATKTFGDSVRVTGGIGWGRMGTYNGFDNPLGLVSDYFDDRPGGLNEGETGGEVEIDRFFRGPAAFFGGVEWAFTDALMFKAEYSSDDAYVDRRGNALLDRRTPLNIGLSWRPRPGYQLDLAYLYGSELALTGTILVNPNNRLFGPGMDNAPVPVFVRGADPAAARTWAPGGSVNDNLAAALEDDGFGLVGLEITGTTARVRYTNGTYRSNAQALGRVARILTNVLPANVETLVLEGQTRGIPLSAVTFSRTDIESLENEVGGTAAALDRAIFSDAGPVAGLTPGPANDDPFKWGLAPFVGFTLFGSESPLQLDLGLELSARYEIQPNLILSGAMRYSVIQQDPPEPPSRESTLPPVRSSVGQYAYDGNPSIEYLTLAWYGRPGRDLYSRVTLGYLEPMFGGISAEVLYAPVDQRWALGVEANYVAQRDSDGLFGFGDYDNDPANRDYAVATGHASLYYDFQNGFHGQVDVGRYLAGDWGATVALDREFDNGWSVGAYFTLTDVPFEDFGEGSFDKGIRITVPMDFVLGQPTRREVSGQLASLARDGGARLEVDGRLYDFVRDGHVADMTDTWGRFWR